MDVIDGSCAEPITTAQTRKKEKDNAVTSKIIKEGVNDNLYINIIKEKKPPKVLENSLPSLFISWLRSCLLYTQKTVKLSKDCKAS